MPSSSAAAAAAVAAGDEEGEDRRREHLHPTRLMDFDQHHHIDDFSATAEEDGPGRGRRDDLVSLPWPFDPLAFLSSPSPPLPPLPPPSPLWLFEDRPPDASPSIAGAVDLPRFVLGNHEMADESGVRVFLPAMEEASADSSCLIKERMTKALRHFKELTDQQVLVQVWAPVKNGSRWVLTTSGQPFVLHTRSMGLLQYRTVSSTFIFSVDGEDDCELGLPGRVFRQKVPEWTPNVQYYSSREYPRLCHALNYDVRGTLALPVFELSGRSCIAVVELIMTAQKINYSAEVDKVCKALEAVNLKSSEILDHPDVQICNEGRQAALAEILQILAMVCEEHKLPLAQTWVPCMHRNVLVQGGGSKKNCSSFDGSCMGQVCMSTTDVAFHVIDGHMWGFREACAEHHLQKGQGVAGRSFASRKPFFSKDITQFCKTEYPLVHYARLFGLSGCFAVCLQSSFTGSDDYILEFFLPTDCKDAAKQHSVLKSMITLMVKCLHSLKIITDLEIEEEHCEVIEVSMTENRDVEPQVVSVWIPGSHFSASRESRTSENINNLLKNTSAVSNLVPNFLKDDQDEKYENQNIDLNNGGSSSFVSKNKRPSERKRGKAEKTISLEVLKQYFTGSLKDAAKSLGVCPTTMKRICRQHGISRWPSRKINKVNRSLSKLKHVIESVQGTDAAFNLTSFTGTLPPGVGSIAWPNNLDELEQDKGAEPSNLISGRQEDTSNHLLPNLVNQSSTKKEQPCRSNHSSRSRSSSGQGSTNTVTSHGSSLGSPTNEVQAEDRLVYPSKDTGNLNIMTLSMADAILVEPQAQNVQMLIEDSGSSQDLRNLCAPPMECGRDENFLLPAVNPPQPVHMENSRTVTVKASYKEDIIRFRLPYSAGIMILRNEVAHRLKLEVGTFDIKYLDDDHEWVILVSNADLEECIEVSRRSGGQLIRLSIIDSFLSLGSSCESTGGL